MTRRYRIEHRTKYTYSDDVTTSFGRVYLRPREAPGQRCIDHTLIIDPPPSDVSDRLDLYGNHSTYFHVTDAHTELTVTGVSEVEITSPATDPEILALPWEQSRPSVTHDSSAVEFTLPSKLVSMPPKVREYAEISFPPGRSMADAVNDLTHRIFTEFTYKHGATTVSSSVTDVMEAKAGVCQGFALVAVGCLRSMGLAARYVSGYLSTYAPAGKERMIGVDASHAWAAVLLKDGSWFDFDPTNDTLADERYTTVAWGRDYDDVPPLRGVIFTDAKKNKMDVSVDVAPL